MAVLTSDLAKLELVWVIKQIPNNRYESVIVSIYKMIDPHLKATGELGR